MQSRVPSTSQSIQSENFSRIPGFFPGFRENVQIGENCRNLRRTQSRGFERPRRSRSQHSNPGGARCLSRASVVQMLAAASIKVMDALFGFLAHNDAECCKRELQGRSWRRDWAMHRFHVFDSSQKQWIFANFQCFLTIGCSGYALILTYGTAEFRCSFPAGVV